MTNVVIRLAGAAWLPHLARWIIHVVTKAALVSVHVSGQRWGLHHAPIRYCPTHSRTNTSFSAWIHFITSNCVASGAAFRASITVTSSWQWSVTALFNCRPFFFFFPQNLTVVQRHQHDGSTHVSTRHLLSRLKHWGNKRRANYNALCSKCSSARWAEPPNHLSKHKAA